MASSGIALIILSGFGVSIIYPTVMELIAKIYPDSIDVVMTFILTIMGISIVIGVCCLICFIATLVLINLLRNQEYTNYTNKEFL